MAKASRVVVSGKLALFLRQKSPKCFGRNVFWTVKTEMTQKVASEISKSHKSEAQTKVHHSTVSASAAFARLATRRGRDCRSRSHRTSITGNDNTRPKDTGMTSTQRPSARSRGRWPEERRVAEEQEGSGGCGKTAAGDVGRDRFGSRETRKDTCVEPCTGGLGSALPGDRHQVADRPVVSSIRDAHS